MCARLGTMVVSSCSFSALSYYYVIFRLYTRREKKVCFRAMGVDTEFFIHWPAENMYNIIDSVIMHSRRVVCVYDIVCVCVCVCMCLYFSGRVDIRVFMRV